jgi:hypothetical protein
MKNKVTEMIVKPTREIKALADRLKRFRDHKVGPILDDDSQNLIQGG